MPDDLKFHYSNPLFEGLPWAVDLKNKKAKKRIRGCVKKPFDKSEVNKEIKELRSAFPQCKWWHEFCVICNAFHVCRKGTSYVREW
jgi:hypothetical protein